MTMASMTGMGRRKICLTLHGREDKKREGRGLDVH